MHVPSHSPTSSSAVLVDAHVHLHDGFATDDFLDAAAANVAAAARELRLAGDTPGMLLLTESQGVDAFGRLADGRLRTEPWRIEPTSEPVSLLATRSALPPLVLVAGRQIVTAERLEVLALGTRATFADGQPTRDVLAATLAASVLTVLPWGVGKWVGWRHGFVKQVLQDFLTARLYTGDIGGRLAWLPRPRLLNEAERYGGLVLPGSDPLPFPSEVTKPGRYGFVAHVNLDRQRPFAVLKRWLDVQTTSPQPYGRLERPLAFVRHQIGMQVKSRGQRK